MVVPEPLYDGESAKDQVIVAQKGLKYFPPDLTLLDNVCQTKDMKDLLWEHMDFDHMTDEVMTACEMLAKREADEGDSRRGEEW